ncbi:MAG TPA: hypothetical protein VN578_00060 [Candidatus Binatia bacterium]|jgi:hypothetical protein|nr:hypothetical protein [Candidatus Binatia bacterium]
MSLFKKKGEVTGTVRIADLPPFIGYSASLSLFEVSSVDAPPPFPDVAPPEARLDEAQLGEATHFEREDITGTLEVSFRLRRPAGWYYLQLNVILYRMEDGKRYAQVERFPFRKRPLEIPAGGQVITLPVSWPKTPIADLEQYGMLKPGGKGRLY